MAHRTVMLAMDFQNAITESFRDAGVLERARDAVAAARSAGIPVIWVRVAVRPEMPAIPDTSAFGRVGARGDTMGDRMPATQIDELMGARDDEPVVLKRRISAFAGSDLEVLLRGVGADTLVLAGISTSGVVLSTLRYAADLDYRLTVLSDACADRDEEVHRVLTEKVFPRQAAVLTVAEWAAGL